MQWPRLVTLTLMLGAIALGAILSRGDDRVQELCRKAQPGMSVSELNSHAERAGLGERIVWTGASVLSAGKVHGSFRCTVHATNGVVQDVEFDASR